MSTKLNRLLIILSVLTLSLVSAYIPTGPVYAIDEDGCEVEDVTDGSCLDQFYILNDISYDPTVPVCSSFGSAVTELVGEDNRQKIWNYLTARGLSSIQAAGVMGNLQSESGGTWSPTVNEFSQPFGEGGYGIAQWTHDPGRRANLITYMTEKSPSLMETYYKAEFSTPNQSYTSIEDGFVGKSALTDELIPVEDNDALLLYQLDFLYDESNNRPLGSLAIEKGLGEAGDNEWDVLKEAETIEDASNIWVYSFEIPANIEVTAIDRIRNAESIYDIYVSDSDGVVCSSASKRNLAQQIIDSGNLSYWVSGMPESERNILPDIASGANNGNDWPCGMNLYALQMLAALTKEHRISVTSLNRACSDSRPTGSGTWSRHYAGNGSAFDLDTIDGMLAESQAGADLIVELISPYLLPGSRIGQTYDPDTGAACLPNLNVPSGVGRLEDYCHHLHIDMPPNIDLELRCKTPITAGGCDESQRV